MLRNKEVKKRPFEPCAFSAVYPEAAAGKFDSARIIYNSELGAEIHVVLRVKPEFGFFAENFYYFVVFFFARFQVFVGNVRHNRKHIENLLFEVFGFRVAFRDFIAQRSHLREYRVYGFAFFFEFGYFRRNLIAFRFQRFYFRNDFSSFFVERKKRVEIRFVTFLFKKGFYMLFVFLYPF